MNSPDHANEPYKPGDDGHDHDHEHGDHEGCDHSSSNPWETRSLIASGALVGIGLIIQWTKALPARSR